MMKSLIILNNTTLLEQIQTQSYENKTILLFNTNISTMGIYPVELGEFTLYDNGDGIIVAENNVDNKPVHHLINRLLEEKYQIDTIGLCTTKWKEDYLEKANAIISKYPDHIGGVYADSNLNYRQSYQALKFERTKEINLGDLVINVKAYDPKSDNPLSIQSISKGHILYHIPEVMMYE